MPKFYFLFGHAIDAATMIAVSTSGSMEDFAKLMNKKAQKLNMENSYFINSHGLENDKGQGNTSTAYDMALLTSYAMHNKTFRKIFSTEHYTAKSSKKTYSWTNKNKLLKYDYVTGGKTGYTQKAHRTLVTTGRVDDKNLVIVTLNDGNDWNDHKNLYKTVKDNYQKVNILSKKDFKVTDDTIYIEDTLYIKKNFTKILNNSDVNKLKIKYYLNSKKKYHNNENVGSANIYLGDKLIHSEPIYIKLEKQSFVSKVIKWFKNLVS